MGVAIPGLFPFPTREVFIEETTGLYRVWFLAEEKVEEITEEKSEAPVQEQGSESGDEELLNLLFSFELCLTPAKRYL